MGNLQVDHIKYGQLPMNLCLRNMVNLSKYGQLTIVAVDQKRVEIWSTSNNLLNASWKLSICHLRGLFCLKLTI